MTILPEKRAEHGDGRKNTEFSGASAADIDQASTVALAEIAHAICS
jgi:hypothetical protein